MEHRSCTDMFIINELLENWTIEKLLPGHYCYNAEDGRNFIEDLRVKKKFVVFVIFLLRLDRRTNYLMKNY